MLHIFAQETIHGVSEVIQWQITLKRKCQLLYNLQFVYNLIHTRIRIHTYIPTKIVNWWVLFWWYNSLRQFLRSFPLFQNGWEMIPPSISWSLGTCTCKEKMNSFNAHYWMPESLTPLMYSGLICKDKNKDRIPFKEERRSTTWPQNLLSRWKILLQHCYFAQKHSAVESFLVLFNN